LEDKEIDDDLNVINGVTGVVVEIPEVEDDSVKDSVEFSDCDDIQGTECDDASIVITHDGGLVFRNHVYNAGDSIVVENRKGNRSLGVIISISHAEVNNFLFSHVDLD
jgi:hypothetical protein